MPTVCVTASVILLAYVQPESWSEHPSTFDRASHLTSALRQLARPVVLATMASLLLIAASALIIGTRPASLKSVFLSGMRLGAVAIGLLWLSIYIYLRVGAGDYERIMEFVVLALSPLVVAGGAVVGGIVTALTRWAYGYLASRGRIRSR